MFNDATRSCDGGRNTAGLNDVVADSSPNKLAYRLL